MKTIRPTITMVSAVAAVAMVAGLGSSVAQAEVKAHVVDSSDQVWMNSYGECWRASYPTDKARVECGDVAPVGDSDGDGVPDDKDECPYTPKGVKVDARGCELDSDGDGVADSKDKCPGTPAGIKVDSNGCELDSDGDGVVDSKDHCPGTPAGVKVDMHGCPEAVVLEGVNFKHDSAKLTDSAKTVLDGVAETLRARPDMHVTIVGHTDSQGTDAYNMGLSQRRAESVRAYLVSKGVNASNLSARGDGESKPIADNKTAEGRAKNRRVELQ